MIHESINAKSAVRNIICLISLFFVTIADVAAQVIPSKIFSTMNDVVKNRALKSGDHVKILGYYKINDGGTAEYYIRKKEAADSSEHVIDISNGLNAVLLTPPSVNYKMFGAKGDGVNNDAIQIAKAHAYANRKSIPVINNYGDFWLKEVKKIEIRTNVNWGKTIFHIDERFNTASSPRFEIASDYKPRDIILSSAEKSTLLASIKPGVRHVPLLSDYKNCLIFITDANDRIGFRSGADYKGQSWAREEFFYVEEHGRIIGDVAWEFKDYTKLTAYYVDENYLKVEGGTFYLSGNSPTTKGRGYLRNGISITRSRTIISDQWVGLAPGAEDTSTLNPRSGFYTFSRVFDVKLENVRLIPYEQNRGGEARNVSAGTYGISMGRVMNCTFKNVTAEGSNVHWGVFGSNLIKNFNVENCRINRVDVHFHCWNLRISNSDIGYKGITVTGGGNLFIENSSCAGRSFINFRSDFGSKWDGDIKIVNCAFKVSAEDKTISVLAFAPRDFDYKYPVGFGRSIVIENFSIDFSAVKNKDATCWMMRIPSFSKMKSGERLFFPELVKFDNIKVTGREKGLRLFEISEAGAYQLRSAGGYKDSGVEPNANFLFSNISLEDLRREPLSAFHFAINSSKTYDDKYALYPSIKFSDCRNLVVKNTNAVSDIFFNNCGVSAFGADKKQALRGRLLFDQCSFLPILKDENISIYNINSEHGTSFTDCTIHAPEYKNELRPDMIDKTGVIEINKKVRFNHSNTLLGRDIINYYKNKKISFSPKFISMLKSHHEMEPDFVN